MDALLTDLRYVVRTPRKSPVFTIVAVLTLSVHIHGQIIDVHVDAPDQAKVHERITYGLAVKNKSNVTAGGLIAEIALSTDRAKLQEVKPSAAATQCYWPKASPSRWGTRIIDCYLRPLEALERETIEVVLTSSDLGPITVHLTVRGSDGSELNSNANTTNVCPADGCPPFKGGDPCFIATAAYGSSLDPHVQSLRAFRNRWLVTNAAGRRLVAVYTRVSPPLAAIIATRPALRFGARMILFPVVYSVEYPRLAILILIAITIFAVRRLRLKNEIARSYS